MPVTDILELIDRIAEVRQADAAQIANLLGGQLRFGAKQPDRCVSWEVVGAAPVHSAYLCLPKTANDPHTIDINFNVNTNECTTVSRFDEKYGLVGPFYPTPYKLPGDDYYRFSPPSKTYRQSWGSLIVTYMGASNAPPCVLRVALRYGA
jgi:hypothetical protein